MRAMQALRAIQAGTQAGAPVSSGWPLRLGALVSRRLQEWHGWVSRVSGSEWGAYMRAIGATVAVALAAGALCALIVCAIPIVQGEDLIDAMYDHSGMLGLEYDAAEVSWQHSNAKLGTEQVHGEHAEKV